jgi:hypothetical protein
MFKNKTTELSGKKKDVQVREWNLIPMSISPLYDIDIRDKLEILRVLVVYILCSHRRFNILQIVILLWLFMATKEKLEYEDFVGFTEWGKG